MSNDRINNRSSHHTSYGIRAAKPTRIMWSIAATLALLATACGGGSDRDQALVDALAADLMEGEDALANDQGEADCAAEKTYDALGEERMAELGITVETPDPTSVSLTEAEVDGVLDALFDCIDMQASLARTIQGDDLTAEDAECVVGEIGDDGLRTMMRTGMSGQEDADVGELLAIMGAAAESCGVPLS